MHSNRIVTRNIDKIRDDVESATTQDDLLTLIKHVETHSGPLNYRDPTLQALKWLLTAFCALLLFLIFIHNDFEWVSYITHYLIDDAGFWMPVIWAVIAMNFLYDRGIYPISAGLNLLLLSAVMAVVATYVPRWPKTFWNAVEELIALISFGFSDYRFDKELTFVVLVFLLTIGLWGWLYFRANWRKPMSDRIFLRDALINNELTEITGQDADNAKSLAKQFNEFRLGGNSGKIVLLCQGRYQKPGSKFVFRLFHFQYTVTKNKTKSTSDGGYQSTTTEEVHNRYGILLDFPYASSLTINGYKKASYKGVDYHSESTAFNRFYTVRSKEALTAARILKPAVIDRLIELRQQFDYPTLDINDQGRMCISTSTPLISEKRQHSLSNPAEFYQEIAGHTELVGVNKMLDYAHDLLRLSDNNFQQDS